MSITLAVDGDPYVYAAGFAVQKTHINVSNKNGKFIMKFEGKAALNIWLKENSKKATDFILEEDPQLEPIQAAHAIINGMIAEAREKYQAEQVIVYLTDDRKGFNFRDYSAFQRKYKDRPANKRPVYYKALRDYMITEHDAIVCTGYEADDAVSMQGYAALQQGDHSVVIVSIDKDLLQVPGRHYNPVKKVEKIVTPEEGLRLLYKQILMGDTTDTIPGMPGIGEKKAITLLADCNDEEEMYQVCLDTYKKKFGEAGIYVLTETARLVYMLRYPGDVWLGPHDCYFKEL